jgi:hypothetical protein
MYMHACIISFYRYKLSFCSIGCNEMSDTEIMTISNDFRKPEKIEYRPYQDYRF